MIIDKVIFGYLVDVFVLFEWCGCGVSCEIFDVVVVYFDL